MTLIVGIRCADGVVVASDSAATLAAGTQPTIGQQANTKVHQLGDEMLYASCGAVGMSQLIRDAFEKAVSVKGPGKQNTSADLMRYLSSLIGDQLKKPFEQAIASIPLVGRERAGLTVTCSCIVGVVNHDTARLYQFDTSGMPEEATKELPFVALGSGQGLADPFLALLKRVLWSDREPNLAEGRFAAAWTIVHVARTNPGGVALPLQLSSLCKIEGKWRTRNHTPEEHYEAIDAAEKALLRHVRPDTQPLDQPVEPPPEPPAT